MRTNPLAIAALVTGAVGLVPVAVPCGIVALVRLRRTHENGRGLAIAGLVVSGVWLVLAAVVVVGLLVGGLASGADPVGTIQQAGSTSVGSCLVHGGADGGALDTAVLCTQRHDEEVYRTDVLDGGEDYPGQGDLTSQADDACYSAFRSYIGSAYEDSAYDYGYYVPDAGEWFLGEHRYVCVVLAPGADPLPETVAGSHG